MYDVGIIGSSISANLVAAFIKQQLPHLTVVCIGPSENRLPIVGESLTEFSTYTLNCLGLRSYLEEKHNHKYGLSFYFKSNLNDPSCDSYVVHEAPSIPPLPGKQLNRFTFDPVLSDCAKDSGVIKDHGMVTEFRLNEDSVHELKVKSGNEFHQVKCRWLIDASGRKHLLASQKMLLKKPEFQRSSFWFRLKNYDRQAFQSIKAIKPAQIAFDSYYATHHFIGKNRWVWCIPMRDAEGSDILSIGLVWRPDLSPETPRSVEEFLQVMDGELPIVSKIVRSGTVEDTNFYSNYLYSCTSVYGDSREKWALISDAGFSVDPLYSTGIVITSIQAHQLVAMLRAEKCGTLDDVLIRDLEGGLLAFRDAIQHEISTLYEVMHDPYQMSWRVHFSSTLYFFFLLPAWLSGYMSDGAGARLIKKVFMLSADDRKSMLQLLQAASKNIGVCTADKIPNRYKKSVNWELWGPCASDVARYFSTLQLRFATYRLMIMREAGPRFWLKHGLIAARTLLFAAVIRVTVGRTPLKDSWLAKLIAPKNHKPTVHSKEMRDDSCMGAKSGDDETQKAA